MSFRHLGAMGVETGFERGKVEGSKLGCSVKKGTTVGIGKLKEEKAAIGDHFPPKGGQLMMIMPCGLYIISTKIKSGKPSPPSIDIDNNVPLDEDDEPFTNAPIVETIAFDPFNDTIMINVSRLTINTTCSQTILSI